MRMERRGPSDNVSQETKLVTSALKVGAVSGVSGLIYGGVSGVWQASHPVIKSISSGIHWFAFGTSYWALRSFILQEQFKNEANPKQKEFVSTIAGGLAGGGVNWVVNRRFLPGLVVFSLLGYVGQKSYATIDGWHTQRQLQSAKPWTQQLSESNWVPFKVLSDEQYKEMLSDKLLSVEAEIALIDEKIQALKDAEAAGKNTKD
ncbi:hypothetical protein VTO42DRAFT_900 [Malbranchea cinnamomea]